MYEDVKLAKNVNLEPHADTVLHVESWDTSLQSVRRIYFDIIRETENGYPKRRTGISRRKESVPSVQRLQSSFGTVLVRDISELLNGDLTVTAANGSSIPYKRWVELDLQIGDSEQGLSVPFLVASEEMELPLIGFNAIEH